MIVSQIIQIIIKHIYKIQIVNECRYLPILLKELSTYDKTKS